MTYDDPGKPETEPQMVFGGGVLVGALVLGLVWLFVSLLGPGGGDRAADSPGAGASAGQQLIGSDQPPRPGVAERCIEAVTALRVPLAAAGPAMDQWAVHIGAMNKLVVGQITLAQASAFWNATRVGAHHRITAFRSAMRALRSQGVDCPGPDLLPADASAGLRSCSRLAAADRRTLRAAQTAVDTWAMHVRDMERLRAGTLSPAAATSMWLMMWQRGQDQLQAYRAAAAAARKAGSCSDALDTPAS